MPGVNMVDTADFYSGGEAEEILGALLAERRDDARRDQGALPDGR